MPERKYISKIRKDGQLVYLKDVEAREELITKASKEELDAMALIPVDVSALTPRTTFRKGSVIGINGVLYRAAADTTYLPFTLVVQDGAFVTVEVGGIDVFIIADPTLNLPWKPWTDASVQAHLTDLDLRLSTLETMNYKGRIEAIEEANKTISQTLALHESRITAVEARTQSVTYNGHTYTLQQIMAQVAKLMDATVIIEQPEE